MRTQRPRPHLTHQSEGKGHHGKKAKGHNFTKSVARQHFGLVLEKWHANMQFKFSATGRIGYAVWQRERGTATVTTRVKFEQNHVFPEKQKQTGGANSSYHTWTRAWFLTVTSHHHRFTSANKKQCSHAWIWRVWHLQKHSSWFISSLYLHVLYKKKIKIKIPNHFKIRRKNI